MFCLIISVLNGMFLEKFNSIHLLMLVFPPFFSFFSVNENDGSKGKLSGRWTKIVIEQDEGVKILALFISNQKKLIFKVYYEPKHSFFRQLFPS